MQERHVGQYQLREVLGQGAFGTVYKAFNINTGITVAIKIIKLRGRRANAPLSENPAQLIPQSELNEITLLQQLSQHENILQYQDHFVQDDVLYIATEYIETGSLQSILKQYHNISEEFAFNAIFQTLKGLSYLHSQNILHRDIKAANLLIDKNGTVKIADFGVAETFKTAQNLEEIAGTPYWIAKEVLLMEYCDEKSDIWSVGATLYELLTGNPPYFDLDPPAACYRIATYGVQLGLEFSTRARRFMERCFSDHKDRPTADYLLKEEFGYEHFDQKVVLEPLEPALSGFSDDEDDYNATFTMAKTSSQLVVRQLRAGLPMECTVMTRDIMNEVIFKETSLILNSLNSANAFEFLLDVLEFAQRYDKLELAMRKLEFGNNGLIRRLIKFFNQYLADGFSGQEGNAPIKRALILRFLHLIYVTPIIYPLYIVSNLFVLLKQIFQYSLDIKNVVIQVIFQIFNLQQFQLKADLTHEFGDFSRYQISQYMACSDICTDIVRYILQLNTFAIENNQFTSKYDKVKSKCVHAYQKTDQLNISLIIIQNATMILSIIAQYYPLSLNISDLCYLHAFYVECKHSACSFPQTILIYNLDIIYYCYKASGSLTKQDISVLLDSSQHCKEAEDLCIQIFYNSPYELHNNLDFYNRFKSNISLLVVLLKVSPRHPNITQILSILNADVASTIQQRIEGQLLICLQIFTLSYTLAVDCQRLYLRYASTLITTLSSKHILDVMALQLTRKPPAEFILLQFTSVVEKCPIFCLNLLGDVTLMLGFFRNMRYSSNLVSHYLRILKCLIHTGKRKFCQKYAVGQYLRLLIKSCNSTMQNKIKELLSSCD